MPAKKPEVPGADPPDAGTTPPEEPAPPSEGPGPVPDEVPRRPLPGESTDPHVHHLLAVRQAHMVTLGQNPDAANRALGEQKMAEIDAQLHELGYQVG